jgi:hypothetical protein
VLGSLPHLDAHEGLARRRKCGGNDSEHCRHAETDNHDVHPLDVSARFATHPSAWARDGVSIGLFPPSMGTGRRMTKAVGTGTHRQHTGMRGLCGRQQRRWSQ